MVLVAKLIVLAIFLVILPSRIKLLTCISVGIVSIYIYPFYISFSPLGGVLADDMSYLATTIRTEPFNLLESVFKLSA